jgi:hypothetical protein
MGDRDRRDALVGVVRLQSEACGRAGSPLYARILEGVCVDLTAGGICADILAADPEEPLTSALALRFLGALHRIVLEGREPELARFYPSAGGDPSRGDPVPPFLTAVLRHRDEIVRRLPRGVQTNEVGRSAVLAGGFVAVARATGLPLRTLELGASAGLNSRWDRYWYDTGRTTFGDPSSPVRFTDVWDGEPPDLAWPAEVVERRGCDREPLDPTDAEDRLTLLSYVWPDQVARVERLEAALEVARSVPIAVERDGAAEWLGRTLDGPVPGAATVVTHTIVLQYLPAEDRRALRAAIDSAGDQATAAAPLAWLRMEPAGERAELRLTTWPGGAEQLLATAGYHGRPIRWLAG